MKALDTLIIFGPTSTPSFLLVVTSILDNDEPLLQISVFQMPALSLKKTFSLQAPLFRLDPEMKGEFSADGKLVLCAQRKDQDCCVLFLIDLENGSGSCQLCPNFRHLVYVESKQLLVSITTRGWVQSKTLKQMELDIKKYGDGYALFDGLGDADWVSENWRKLLYIPPSFLPTYESGLAVRRTGELAFVSDFGKRLVQISFRW
jgi:hypothetical protein